MDFEKLSDRLKGFLQAAQTIALRDGNPQITPDHLLKALLAGNKISFDAYNECHDAETGAASRGVDEHHPLADGGQEQRGVAGHDRGASAAFAAE